MFFSIGFTRKEILRRNPLGDRVISVSSGQKFCTRKILRALPSFLHFLEAKDIKKNV